MPFNFRKFFGVRPKARPSTPNTVARQAPAPVRKVIRKLIPDSWLPNAPMRRVHVHWTAGSHTASSLDKEHYHFLIEGDGDVVRGHIPVTGNVPPLKSGKYAAHTRKANSYSIGVGCCAMAGATTRPLSAGRYPLTEKQWNNMVQVVAEICSKYDIPVNNKTVLTHAEVQTNLGIRQNGKWDIAYLPFWKQSLSAKEVGDKMRSEVSKLV